MKKLKMSYLNLLMMFKMKKKGWFKAEKGWIIPKKSKALDNFWEIILYAFCKILMGNYATPPTPLPKTP